VYWFINFFFFFYLKQTIYGCNASKDFFNFVPHHQIDKYTMSELDSFTFPRQEKGLCITNHFNLESGGKAHL